MIHWLSQLLGLWRPAVHRPPALAGECRLCEQDVLAIAGQSVPNYASRLHVVDVERTATGLQWVVCAEGLGHLPVVRVDDVTGTTADVVFMGRR